jgi:hypothetical protein
MNANLLCFLIGMPVVLLWVRALSRGVMLGFVFGWIRRGEAPVRFWLCAAVYGILACGFLVAPILSWFRPNT